MRLHEIYSELEELHKPAELEQFRNSYKDDASFRKRDSKTTLNSLMQDKGFKLIGDGLFAQVYEHPKYPESVFKIFFDDPKTLKWLELCKQNDSNPYFPRIKGKPIQIIETAYLVRLEKLKFKSKKSQETYEELFWEIKNIIKSNFDVKDLERVELRLQTRQKPKVFESFMEILRDENFINCLKVIKTLGGNFDIHSENFMWRGNQMVITDPISS